MADDVVILLSSDDSCDNAFVTPHPRTASIGRPEVDAASPEKTRQSATSPVGHPEHLSSIPSQHMPSASPVMRLSNQNADVIEIDDTPAAVSRTSQPLRPVAVSRSGFLGFSSDDLSSSPFQGDTALGSDLPPPELLAAACRSPLPDLIRDKAARAAVQRMQDSRARADDYMTHSSYEVGDDGGSCDSADKADQDRPAKRLRLSSSVSRGVSTELAAEPTTPVHGRATGNLHSPTRLSQTIATQTQRRLQLMADFDDEDDAADVVPTICPSKAAHTSRVQRSTSLSGKDECIDLLSSSESESEANRTLSSTELPPTDSDFVDIDDLLRSAPRAPKRRQQQQQQQQQHSEGQQQRQPSDDIMLLSSSPPVSVVELGRPEQSNCVALEPTLPTRRQNRPLQRSFSEGHKLIFSDEGDDEDAIAAEAFLADWRKNHPEAPHKAKARAKAKATAKAPAQRRSSFDEVMAAPPSRKKQPVDEEKRKELATAKDQRQKDREAERERRRKEKEVDKERRKIASDLAKEQKAKERAESAAFNNANKSRDDKAVATPEMIVRLPTSLPEATRETAEGMLTDAKANYEPWTSTPVDNVVTWRRKLSNEYRPDLGHWVPVPTRVEDEKYALVVLRAEELVQLIVAGQSNDPDARHAAGGHDLASHVALMKRAFVGYTIVYLVEGLHAWRNKNKTIRNRQFVAAVRGDGSAAATGSSNGQQSGMPAVPATAAADAPVRASQRLGRRGQKQAPRHIDEALVDDALLDLQIGHYSDGELLVHETAGGLDTARWMRVFTEQIAIGRYRQNREALYAAAASFCMDSGQIATGDDPQHLYTLILQQVSRVTEPVALGVAARFGNIPRLVQGFREEGPLALEAVLKSRNRNGALSDRTIGPALSRRLHKVFMGRDAESTEV